MSLIDKNDDVCSEMGSLVSDSVDTVHDLSDTSASFLTEMKKL